MDTEGAAVALENRFNTISALLKAIEHGEIEANKAEELLGGLLITDMAHTRIDNARKYISGNQEVVFSAGKTDAQLIEIAKNAKTNNILFTRLEPSRVGAILAVCNGEYNKSARTLVVNPKEEKKVGKVMVVCAGTSDIPVAEEAAVTAEVMGANVSRLCDVGVAGIHRLLAKLEEIRQANVVVAVAGMEGALASVVAGLVDKPVIAVPTSVGYGASFGGLAALLSMLNGCAAGISVVNIDNGFGAGYQAAMINRLICRGDS